MTGFDSLSIISGVFITLVGALAGNYIKIWYYRPRLKIDISKYPFTIQGDVSTLTENAGVLSIYERPVNLYCHRIKVINDGRTAAKNVRGIIEFDNGHEDMNLVWYDGYVKSIIINKGDHSLLAVYGIIMEGNRFTNQICLPTENAWRGLKKTSLGSDLKGKIKVTAENADLVKQEFKIPSTIPCEIEFFQ